MMSATTSSQTKAIRLEELTCLDEIHPYGVLPGGNQFFASDNSTTGDAERRLLSDKLWQQVLGFCDAETLGNVAQVSRYLYVASHQPELWRDLVLRKCDKDSRVIDTACKSWKDTYVRLFFDPKAKPHTPIQISGIYSDDYYRTHLCRSFALPESWFAKEKPGVETIINSIPTVRLESMTPEKYLEFEEQNRPVIIEGAGRTRAWEHWKEFEYMLKHNAAGKSFRTTSGGAPLSANFTFEAYNEYSKFDYLEESPMYLFDRTAFDDNQQWKDDYFPEFYKKCPWWNPAEKQHGHDLLQCLGAERRPDHTWLIMGPKRSGSVYHIDPNATHAWNVAVQGRKRWIFYPPGVSPPGVYPSDDGDEVTIPLSVGEWLTQYWSEHMDQYKKPIEQQPLECTLHPGDVIFVPHGWWHMVVNLDDNNIAITHNYVSASNLGNVLKFFVDKTDQISGCRDRVETVKPEQLHDELVKSLKENEPEVLARAQAQKGWQCKAWKDYPSEEEIRKENSAPQLQQKKRQRDGNDTYGSCSKESKTSVFAKGEEKPSFAFSFF